MPKATDMCIPFFDVIKERKTFEWTKERQKAFQELKNHLESPLMLSSSIEGECLLLYMAVLEHAISSVLVREEDGIQFLVYYTSKRLKDAEIRYSVIENLAYCLLLSA